MWLFCAVGYVAIMICTGWIRKQNSLGAATLDFVVSVFCCLASPRLYGYQLISPSLSSEDITLETLGFILALQQALQLHWSYAQFKLCLFCPCNISARL